MTPTLESLDRQIRELRAELAITQTGIADLAASHAVANKADPARFVGQWASRLLGLAHAAAEGARPTRILFGVERMCGWAEEYLSEKTGARRVSPAPKPAAEA